MIAAELVVLGFAVCEVATVRPDGSCSCRSGVECQAPGKHPVGNGWMKTAIARRSRPTFRLPAQVRLAPATSYGLIPMPGSGLLVIDRDDPDVLLPLPDTFEVHRASAHPNRGHYYYRLPADIAEDDVPRSFAGGEVRIAGSGHVVGPGCRHVSGDLYEGNDRAVGIADRELIDALRALKPVRRGAGGNVEAVLGSRHAWLTNQARKYRGWGWDEDRITKALLEDNQTKCIPPLDNENDIGRMAEWALKNVAPDPVFRITYRRGGRIARGWKP